MPFSTFEGGEFSPALRVWIRVFLPQEAPPDPCVQRRDSSCCSHSNRCCLCGHTSSEFNDLFPCLSSLAVAFSSSSSSFFLMSFTWMHSSCTKSDITEAGPQIGSLSSVPVSLLRALGGWLWGLQWWALWLLASCWAWPLRAPKKTRGWERKSLGYYLPTPPASWPWAGCGSNKGRRSFWCPTSCSDLSGFWWHFLFLSLQAWGCEWLPLSLS